MLIRATVPSDVELLEIPAGTRVVRVHALGGSHPLGWRAMRTWGPTKSRFDHHFPPPHPQQRAIAYLAYGGRAAFTTAIAEYFQDESGAGVGPLDVIFNDPTTTVFETAADLVLLDLSSGWMTRAGGNQAICAGQRDKSREWARAIYAAYGRRGRTSQIAGLAYPSSVWGPGSCIALWETGRVAFPRSPVVTRSLADPAFERAVAKAARDLGSYVVAHP